MKTLKKSVAKIWPFIFAATTILLVAIFTHPSLKTILPKNSQTTIQSLISNLNDSKQTEAQDLWIFREFYSRGVLHLSKFEKLELPKDLTTYFNFPDSFKPHTLFKSSRISSIEGTIDSNDISNKNPHIVIENNKYKVVYDSNNTKIIQTKFLEENLLIIVATFDIFEASKANGYLYFDLREEEFKQSVTNKKWLVVSLVKL